MLSEGGNNVPETQNFNILQFFVSEPVERNIWAVEPMSLGHNL